MVSAVADVTPLQIWLTSTSFQTIGLLPFSAVFRRLPHIDSILYGCDDDCKLVNRGFDICFHFLSFVGDPSYEPAQRVSLVNQCLDIGKR